MPQKNSEIPSYRAKQSEFPLHLFFSAKRCASFEKTVRGNTVTLRFRPAPLSVSSLAVTPAVAAATTSSVHTFHEATAPSARQPLPVGAVMVVSVATQTTPSVAGTRTKATLEMAWGAVIEKAGKTVLAFLPHMGHVIKGWSRGWSQSWSGLSAVTLTFAPKEESNTHFLCSAVPLPEHVDQKEFQDACTTKTSKLH